jgi:hypothetical protein
MPTRLLLVALVALALGAAASCAPRRVPDEFPSSSPSSPAADAPPRPNVGVPISADPPLPGEDDARWDGLRADAGAAEGHDHHHHHQGHDQGHGAPGQVEPPHAH